MRTRLLIYAAVPDAAMLRQGFYAAEADGLRAHPAVAEVNVTNQLREIARADYDGLVSFFYSYSAAAGLLARLRGRPVVATGGAEQVFPELTSSRRQYFLRAAGFHATTRVASRILATSTSDLDRMRQIARCDRSKIELSFHGASAVERIEGIPSIDSREPGTFVTICGLDTPLNMERKGIPEALLLLAKARGECAEAKLTIIGRSTCREMVEKSAGALGAADRVFFAGYVSEDEKIALLRTHRYYVQLSVYEGFGIGALEALSQGCQVIHSGAGGLADTIADFGFTLRRDAIESFSLADLPDYAGLADDRLVQHLGRFRPRTRADAILDGLFGAAARNPQG